MHASSTFGRSDAGLSLPEVLVAVFLMALAATAVVATIPPRPSVGLAAAERLRHDLEDIRDIAIVSGRVQGVRLREDGYEHLEWVNGDWAPVARNRVRFGRNVSIALETTRPPSRFESKAILPEIIFDPTGMVAAPSMVLRWDSITLPLSVLPDGSLEWESGNV